MSKPVRLWLVQLAAFVAVASSTVLASAQRPAPAKPPAKPQGPTVPTGPIPLPEEAKPKDLLEVAAGGLTADQAATRARGSSPGARAAESNRVAAEARTRRATIAYLPRFTLTGRYTRLSNFTPPLFGGGTVLTDAPAGTVNPSPTRASTPEAFPFFLNVWFMQAAVSVPLSDYLFTIRDAHAAAQELESAAVYDTDAATAKSYSDAKVAFYTWLRARGAINVAQQVLAVAKAHLRDSEALFSVGQAPKADVLRSETAVAAAEVGLERAKSTLASTERQLRTLMHAKDDETFEPGEALDAKLPPVANDVQALIKEALATRPELKSLERSTEGTRRAAAAARGGRYPQLSAFGEVTVASPNSRKFPATDEFFPTWSAGAQIIWSPNDFLAGGPAVGASYAELDARAAAFEAQRDVLRDSITNEVVTTYHAAIAADAVVGSTDRQLLSAQEGYRVARELYINGRGTSTTLIDSESALAQARFEHNNAIADARITRTQLDHAVGRDVRRAP